jgi:hypothetical protein
LKRYLSDDNRFLPQGGESCGSDVDPTVFSQPYVHCPNAMADLSMMRWSTMNLEHHPAVISLWQQEGCLSEMRRRLGYRFRLIDGQLTTAVSAGQRFYIRLNIVNDGWAAPYNKRFVEIVLRSTETGRLIRFPVSADPRFWTPGGTHVVELDQPTPFGVRSGVYEIFLNLPDPESGLYGRPEYSIRLANAGVWETTTGFNSLLATVEIRQARARPCPGPLFPSPETDYCAPGPFRISSANR